MSAPGASTRQRRMAVRLGIDIGGSGMKGAPVDTVNGRAHRAPLPGRHAPARPVEDVAERVAAVAEHFTSDGPIGITFPGVVDHGVVRTAANMHHSWIGTDADDLFTDRSGRPVALVNDADAAGVAEVRFGAGRDRNGHRIMVTLGTGIGTAVFHDSVLLPNTELGHLELDGHEAEDRAAGNVRDDEKLSWSDYAKRLGRYLNHLHALMWPELLDHRWRHLEALGRFLPHIDVPCEVVPAQLLNEAGIVGAAVLGTPTSPPSE